MVGCVLKSFVVGCCLCGYYNRHVPDPYGLLMKADQSFFRVLVCLFDFCSNHIPAIKDSLY